jgi:hypothetical protein
MKKPPEQYRITEELAAQSRTLDLSRFVSDESYGNNGAFFIPRMGKQYGHYFFAMISNGEGWEHVSVTIPTEKRTPTWEEMCYIKNLFWDETEAVVQFHPPKSDYVNNHPYCLHLWKPVSVMFPLPDPILVGIK